MFWTIFQSICNHEIIVKSNLPTFVVLVGQREKSQKYIDLSPFNKNLNDLNLSSNLGFMNFQMWELFTGSPCSELKTSKVMKYIYSFRII